MTDQPMTVTLPAETSRALQTLAENLGRTPEHLASAAVDRFIAQETQLIAKVELAIEQVRNGQSVSHEEVVRGFRETIAKAALKRA